MTNPRLRSGLRALAAPGLLPWLATGGLLAATLLAAFTSPGGRLLAPPLLASAVLLLATGRSWVLRRPDVERVGLALLPALVCLLLVRLPTPFALALIPPLTLGAILGVLAAGAWRFAPDEGQTGRLWILRHALPACVGPAIGLACVLLPALKLLAADSSVLGGVGLIATGPVAGHLCQRLLSRPPASNRRARQTPRPANA